MIDLCCFITSSYILVSDLLVTSRPNYYWARESYPISGIDCFNPTFNRKYSVVHFRDDREEYSVLSILGTIEREPYITFCRKLLSISTTKPPRDGTRKKRRISPRQLCVCYSFIRSVSCLCPFPLSYLSCATASWLATCTVNSYPRFAKYRLPLPLDVSLASQQGEPFPTGVEQAIGV